jgi:hypothetical protein
MVLIKTQILNHGTNKNVDIKACSNKNVDIKSWH